MDYQTTGRLFSVHHTISRNAVTNEDNDSGLDSLKDDLNAGLKFETLQQKKCLIQEDEMQEDRLNRRGRSDYMTVNRDKLGQFGWM